MLYKEKNEKMPNKIVKLKSKKANKCVFFSHVQMITQPKQIRFLSEKMWPVACAQTYRQTTVGTLSGFQEFVIQPIIKDRPNITLNTFVNKFTFQQ